MAWLSAARINGGNAETMSARKASAAAASIASAYRHRRGCVSSLCTVAAAAAA